MSAIGEHYPENVSLYVPDMSYAADVRYGGIGTVNIPAMVAANADGILDGTSIATAVDTSTFASTYSDDVMGKFGRNVTVVADGAATSTVTITGVDYLNQKLVETLTLNGTSPVLGVKMFRRVDNVVAAVTASRAIDVGWGNRIGLPYKVEAMLTETVSGAVPSNAGAVTAGVSTTVSATTSDTRGYYSPHSSFVPNGDRTYELTCKFDQDNLHGIAQYGG
jgi:hypothetical protein